MYARSYHGAHAHLVHFGAWNRTETGRKLVADAIRTLRHDHTPERVKWEVAHMRQICGSFPVKPGSGDLC